MNNIKNPIARALYIIGFVVIGLGTIAGLALGKVFERHSYYYDEYNWTVTLIVIVSCIVVGILFIAFGEVLNLLQQNADNQNIIISKLGGAPVATSPQPQTFVKQPPSPFASLQSSTETSATHKFRCASCGNMIVEYPCENCGFNFN